MKVALISFSNNVDAQELIKARYPKKGVKIGSNALNSRFPTYKFGSSPERPRLTRKKVERIYRDLELRARGSFQVEELEGLVRMSEDVIRTTSGGTQEYALKRHKKVLRETKSRAEWLKTKSTSVSGNVSSHGFGAGLGRKKEREPIDSS